MPRIINNTDYTFSSDAQQAIHNSMADCGVDTVYTARVGNADICFDFYDDLDNYVFSIDVEGDGSGKPVIYQK